MSIRQKSPDRHLSGKEEISLQAAAFYLCSSSYIITHFCQYRRRQLVLRKILFKYTHTHTENCVFIFLRVCVGSGPSRDDLREII